MEMHQVRYFLAVCATQSFTRAAERCHVSQPALTAALKKLEQELGGSLFYRERSGAKLTTLGQVVYPRFQRLSQESEGIVAMAESHQRLHQVPLRLGVLSTLGPARLAPYLAAFRARAPGVELELYVERSQALLGKLGEGELDVVITNLRDEAPPWCVPKWLYEERYLVVLPPGHALSSRQAVRLADLSGEPYVDRLACELREEVQKLCATRQVDLYATYRTEREEWVQSLVQAGIGFAFLPEHSVRGGETVNRPLVEPEVGRTISLVRASERPLGPAAKLFWEALLSMASSEAPGNAAVTATRNEPGKRIRHP
ncbi:LysR family transcriptional regulator [Chondromyces apiculatus]|uniref:Transcriptional regulator, LysR family n=1 Tax=Chondromyces apiculatus DSM 436 TaxID=1192034 RepID=A0A017T2N0_9BACT|nr:LysR family transcriptional regulator [Chondromyces apiculatus]EYF02816.1 transcriptional regulator, LysR family [Chondromyces apiculatus DSM 436]